MVAAEFAKSLFPPKAAPGEQGQLEPKGETGHVHVNRQGATSLQQDKQHPNNMSELSLRGGRNTSSGSGGSGMVNDGGQPPQPKPPTIVQGPAVDVVLRYMPDRTTTTTTGAATEEAASSSTTALPSPFLGVAEQAAGSAAGPSATSSLSSSGSSSAITSNAFVVSSPYAHHGYRQSFGAYPPTSARIIAAASSQGQRCVGCSSPSMRTISYSRTAANQVPQQQLQPHQTTGMAQQQPQPKSTPASLEQHQAAGEPSSSSSATSAGVAGQQPLQQQQSHQGGVGPSAPAASSVLRRDGGLSPATAAANRDQPQGQPPQPAQQVAVRTPTRPSQPPPGAATAQGPKLQHLRQTLPSSSQLQTEYQEYGVAGSTSGTDGAVATATGPKRGLGLASRHLESGQPPQQTSQHTEQQQQ